MKKFHHSDPVSQDIIQAWYFAELLPWQATTWQYLTSHFPNLPHAMLFSGNAGTGKRAFVYRFIAWVLCQNKTFEMVNASEKNGNENFAKKACGQCESCQWLLANTHPNLYQIPSPLPTASTDSDPTESIKTAKKNPAKTEKKSSTLVDTSPSQSTTAIKIDDIRAIIPFVQQSSQGTRIVVIHHAHAMTLGASNALLKTLEEPAKNVLILLISDTPSQLLPTIRSRLQRFEVSKISPQQSLTFMEQALHKNLATVEIDHLSSVNRLSNYAPFVAMDMLTSPWYGQRQTWLNSWQAIRTGQRLPWQASDYWQKTLSLSDFLYLSQIMLLDLGKVLAQLPPMQQDILWEKLNPSPPLVTVHTLQQVIEQIWLDRRQHIQDKLCYDKLMVAFAAH